MMAEAEPSLDQVRRQNHLLLEFSLLFIAYLAVKHVDKFIRNLNA
jgi:hypothetical protein